MRCPPLNQHPALVTDKYRKRAVQPGQTMSLYLFRRSNLTVKNIHQNDFIHE
jgi:hypothetical protein